MLQFKGMLLIPETENGERGTGNGERGTGLWEQVHSGNPLENSKQKEKAQRETIWVKVSFHRLYPQMASTLL